MIQSSDMFKKIKSLFVVEDPTENADVTTAGSVSNETVSQDRQVPTFQPNPVDAQNSTAQPEARFTDLLLKAIESNNAQGFDYLEFKNSLRSIEKVIPDESMRYKSAFEMAKTMGLSKDKLLESAAYYLNILSTEDKKFKDALENQKNKQIQGRADQLAAVEKTIEDKKQMIEKLTKEIEEAKQNLDAVRQEINESVVKIDTTNQQFVASYNLVYTQIYEDIEKIKANI